MGAFLDLDELAKRARHTFRQKFGRAARWVAAAPGRVNLIGEHTDYNDGFVLPMAINRYTVVAGDFRPPKGSVTPLVARFFSTAYGETLAVPLQADEAIEMPLWGKYVRGVIDALAEAGVTPLSFDAVIDSTVPLGGGLSSSAALEVATATLLETAADHPLPPVEKALLCQRAEHQGVGMPCGIMDQFSSVLCQADHLMLLDCRDQQVEMIPLDDPDVAVLIVNSNVRHELAGGEYATRRRECEQAAARLGVASLRDVNWLQLQEAEDELEPILYRRARHVVGEIERTQQAAQAVRNRQWEQVGQLMAASHVALRDDYEVSCAELDALVEIAADLGHQGGVIGSRMTGGGFGGCTVSLVRSLQADAARDEILARYRERVGIEATAFVTRPAQGARLLT